MSIINKFPLWFDMIVVTAIVAVILYKIIKVDKVKASLKDGIELEDKSEEVAKDV